MSEINPEVIEPGAGIDPELDQERASVYGPWSVNLEATARAWQAYLDNMGPRDLRLQDVCNLMSIAKGLRLARTPTHRDSYDDIRQYSAIALEATARGL